MIMAIGIIYIMTTSVDGLIKIGKTKDFNNRMLILEQNGYWNVSGLKRYYAVRVKDYDEKEKLIHTIFSKSQVAKSELFALDKHIAKAMLESFEGEQVYPEIKVIEKVKEKNNKVEKRPRKPNFSFEQLNIPIGSTLTFVKDSSITCEVIDNTNKIKFRDEIMTLTTAAKILLNIEKGKTIYGPGYFCYNGKLISQIYDELEGK